MASILQRLAVVLLTRLLGQVTPNRTEQVHVATYTQADDLCGPDTGREILKSVLAQVSREPGLWTVRLPLRLSLSCAVGILASPAGVTHQCAPGEATSSREASALPVSVFSP